MALFGRKKGEGGDGSDGNGVDVVDAGRGEDGVDGGSAGDGGGKGAGGDSLYEVDGAKAGKFFEHARAMHETTNYEYAMTLWLQGMRWEPANVDAFEGFFESADNFMASGKAKGATKEQKKAVEGKGAVPKYLGALLEWGAKRTDWRLGLRVMQAAAKLELGEQVHWVAKMVVVFASNDKKAKKADFIDMMESLAAVGDFDLAEKAGTLAAEQDPQDAKLIARVKNMSAEAAMSRAGFQGEGVSQGHFRQNIKDSSRQQELEDEESLSKDEATLGRLIQKETARVKSNPDDTDAWGKLLRHLKERGTPSDEERAYKLSMQAYKRFGAFKWRDEAGEVKIRIARRKVRAMREEAGADPSKRGRYEAGQKKLLEIELEEFKLRVEAYPTDLKVKYEYGRRLFLAERFEEAIEQFQRSKDASGLGNAVRKHLALSFLQLGWMTEAEDTFREAIANHPTTGDTLALELRYGLMDALEGRARDERDVEAAKEALELAGKIAMQDFAFKDIKERRSGLQALFAELRG